MHISQPLMHYRILDHAHVAKRRPAPDLAVGRSLDKAIKEHPYLNTQAAVAKKAGVSQSTVSRMVAGAVDPQSDSLRRVCEALSLPLSMFLDAGSSAAAPALAKDSRTVPLISLVQAGGFGETVDPYQPGDGSDSLICPVRCGPRTFALRVDGESMEPRYHHGDIIYVDPDVPATHGSDVVVRLEDSNEATFKQLVIEGKRRYLKPLNTRFPILEITTAARIVGVVIGATWAKAQTVKT
jgi:SOS-response transcriptional repressor LexA